PAAMPVPAIRSADSLPAAAAGPAAMAAARRHGQEVVMPAAAITAPVVRAASRAVVPVAQAAAVARPAPARAAARWQVPQAARARAARAEVRPRRAELVAWVARPALVWAAMAMAARVAR